MVDDDPSGKYEWQEITRTASFAPRDGAGAMVHDGKMWLIGGWNPDDKAQFPKVCSNDVWSSQNGKQWTRVKPNTFGTPQFDPHRDWEGRHTAGYVSYRGKMWIVGGDANQGHYQFDVWNSSDGVNWKHVNRHHPVPWGPRVLHHTVVLNDRIYVMGGQTVPQFAPGPERQYDDIWSTTDGIKWNRVEPVGPHWSPRGMIGGHAVLHDRIWVLGGGTYDTPKYPERRYHNDVWSSADGVRWTRHLEEASWPARQYHEVAAFDGRMWVLEGYDGHANRNDTWYSPNGVDWTQVPSAWPPRHAASVFVHDDALWLVAGNNMTSDVWRLTRRP